MIQIVACSYVGREHHSAFTKVETADGFCVPDQCFGDDNGVGNGRARVGDGLGHDETHSNFPPPHCWTDQCHQCLMQSSELSRLLSSGCLTARLFPKLTLCELLRCAQISKDLRHGLRDEGTWQRILARSLPAGHALQSPRTSYQTAAFQYATMRQNIGTGGHTAIVTYGSALLADLHLGRRSVELTL